jgi:hypothetical protein
MEETVKNLLKFCPVALKVKAGVAIVCHRKALAVRRPVDGKAAQ